MVIVRTLLCMICLAALSCSSSGKLIYMDLETPRSPNANPNKLLTEAEIAADLSQLRAALNKAYAGKDFIPADQYQLILTKLESIRGVRLAQNLCAELADNLAEIPDGKMRFEFQGKRCNTRPVLKHGEAGANFILKSKRGALWSVKTEPRAGRATAILAIQRLPKFEDPAWKGFLEATVKAESEAQMIVLDLRGVSGGDESMGVEIAKLLNGVRLKMPYSTRWTNETPAAVQLRLNAIEKDLETLHAHKKSKTYQGLLKAKAAQATALEVSIREKKTFSESDWNEGASDFDPAKSSKKPIYILVDSSCAGACEHLVDSFALNPYAKVVGENTAGDVSFANLGALNLKNSGIWVLIPTARNVYADKRFIERKGITPKITVPKGADAIFYIGQ